MTDVTQWRRIANIGALAGLMLWSGAAFGAAPGRGAEGKQAVARTADPSAKMSFVPPSGWSRDSHAPAPNIIFVAPDEPPGSVNIGVVSELVGHPTLAQVVQANRDFAAHTPGLTIYEEHAAMLAGEKAHMWRMHVRPPKGEAHEIRQVFCMRNRRSYILTLAGLPSNIHKYEGAFDKVVASFAWTK